MRGNPILRVTLLALALGLTSLVLSAVLRPPVAPPTTPSPDNQPSSSLVPTYLTVVLSSPATSLSLTEPDGRTISIPISDTLTFEHETKLALSGPTYQADLSVTWQDPQGPKFLHLEFEADNHPTAKVTLHPTGQSAPLNVDFSPSSTN